MARNAVIARTMDRANPFTPRRIRGAAALAAALVMPVGTGGAALADTSPAASTAGTSRFDTSFARFEQLPPPPRPVAGAVDITTIDPPIETERQPEPGASRASRSLGTGVASYYGRRFHGRRTANGERFDMYAMTAAHKTLPFGSRVRVTNPRNGKSVIVRINDRGPFVRGRTIDLSRAAAGKIGIIGSGHGRVTLELLR